MEHPSISRYLAIAGLIILACYATTLAQDAHETPRTEPLQIAHSPLNGLNFGFDKLLTTYHWNGMGRYEGISGPLWFLFDEQYLSTVILSDVNSIRNEEQFGFTAKYRLTDLLRSSIRESSYVLSDNQSAGIGTASSHALYGGIEYHPFDQLMVEPLAGVRFDNQIDQQDRGPSYALSVFSDGLESGGYRSRFGGNVRYDRLDPRILETHFDTLRIDKEFPDRTRNVLQIFFNRHRRDFYFPADPIVQSVFGVKNNIESRTENSLTVGDSIEYPISPATTLFMQANILTRGIGRDVRYRNFSNTSSPALNSNIDEFRIDGSAVADYSAPGGLNASIQVAYQERDESHALEPNDSVASGKFISLSESETRKNNFSHRTLLSTSLSMGLGRSDSVEFSGMTSILRYDTPSDLNTDDRDELRDILGLTYTHRFTSYFSARTLFEVNLNHLVYLSGLRSADNTWNRIFRISPRFAYSPSNWFHSYNTFEVLANYTTYDFEFVAGSVRSFAFRQFAFIDSTTWGITKRCSLSWTHYLRFYERGELNWDGFSERPLFYFEDKTYMGAAEFRVNDDLRFATGLRFFSQARYGYTGAKRTLENYLRSLGPVTTMELNFGSRTRILLNGWYEHQVQTDQASRDLTTITMSCTLRI